MPIRVAVFLFPTALSYRSSFLQVSFASREVHYAPGYELAYPRNFFVQSRDLYLTLIIVHCGILDATNKNSFVTFSFSNNKRIRLFAKFRAKLQQARLL